MTQYERMQKGLIFDTCDPEVQKIQQQYQQKLFEFNQLSPIKAEEKKSIEKDPEKKAEKKKPTIKNIEINNKKINNTNKTVINKEDKANNKTITLKEEQKQEEKDNKTSYEKPHKVINPEKAKINEKLLRTLGIVINGNIYINGGTVNITINNYRRSNNETLRRTK